MRASSIWGLPAICRVKSLDSLIATRPAVSASAVHAGILLGIIGLDQQLQGGNELAAGRVERAALGHLEGMPHPGVGAFDDGRHLGGPPDGAGPGQLAAFDARRRGGGRRHIALAREGVVAVRLDQRRRHRSRRQFDFGLAIVVDAFGQYGRGRFCILGRGRGLRVGVLEWSGQLVDWQFAIGRRGIDIVGTGSQRCVRWLGNHERGNRLHLDRPDRRPADRFVGRLSRVARYWVNRGDFGHWIRVAPPRTRRNAL